MANNRYSVTGKADLSQHDKAFNKSALQVRNYQKKINDARKDVQNFERSATGLAGSLSNVTAAFSSGNIGGFTQGLMSLGPVVGTLTTGFAGLGAAITTALGPIGLITAGVGALVGVGVAAGKSIAEFETHLDELQSLTGLDDLGMDAVSDSAINMSKKFGKSAGDIVDSMKLIGGQRPELLSNAAALASVTDSALVLSQAGKISVEDAAKAISTTLNQMGLSADDTTGVINTLAAAAQAGSADISALNVIFTKAGSAAKTAGLSYQELAAISETLAPKFGSADVAGTALTGTLTKLTSQANSAFNPAVVGMRTALDNLAAAELSEAEIKNLVGESNMTAIKTMIESRAEYSRLITVMNEASKAVGESGIAYQQAAMNTDNLRGATEKFTAAWNAGLLKIGESSAIQMVIDLFKDLMSGMSYAIDVTTDLFSSVFRLIGSLADLLNVGNAIKVVIGALGATFYVVTESVSVVINIVAKLIEYIILLRDRAFRALAQWISNSDIFRPIINGCKRVIEWFKSLIQSIVTLWNRFKKWLGEDVSKLDTNVDVKVTQTVETQTVDTTTPTTTPSVNIPGVSVGKSKSKSASSTTTKAPDFETGSIKDIESQIQKINTLLETSANLSDEQISNYISQKTALEEQLKALKIRAGLLTEKTTTAKVKVTPTLTPGSMAYIEKELSDKQAQLKLQVVGSAEFIKTAGEIRELTAQKNKMQLQVDATQIDEATAKLKAMQQTVESNNTVFQSLGTIFGGIGEAIGGVAGELLSFAGQFAQSTGQMLVQLAQIVAANQAAAMAKGISSASGLAFPFNLAAIATVIGTITSLFASLPKFENGGFVGGTSFSGDKQLVRANAGELIMNTRQQRELWKTINGNGNNNVNNNTASGAVNFRISGKDLVGVLQTQNNKNSRIR